MISSSAHVRAALVFLTFVRCAVNLLATLHEISSPFFMVIEFLRLALAPFFFLMGLISAVVGLSGRRGGVCHMLCAVSHAGGQRVLRTFSCHLALILGLPNFF